MVNFLKKRYRLRIVVPAYPIFNIYSRIAKKTTALGPVSVATVVNKMERWDVEVIDENNLRRYAPLSTDGGANHEFFQQKRPADIVGFYGGLTSTIPRLYKIARFYKNKGVITIAGGQHFIGKNIEEALSSGIDYVVLGEGEETIKELLRALQDKKKLANVKGIAYREKEKIIITSSREPFLDFKQLPLPDFSLVRYAKIKLYPIERVRGCGMDCEFCTVKGKPRYAPPERLIEQISLLVETKGAQDFFIVDDLFGQHRSESIKLCNMLEDYQKNIGRKIDITCQIRLDKAKDQELLSAMRRASINTVAIGFESPIEEELKVMNKKLNPSEMLSLTKIFRKFGFLIHGMFIFGYPLKGVRFSMSVQERIKHFKRFIKKSTLDTVQVLLPIPLPGTELRDRLEKENRLYAVKNIGWEYYDGNFILFEPDEPVSSEELQDANKKIMGKFYQFKYMFMVGLNIFAFPGLVFFLHNIKIGWKKWHKYWRLHLIRFGGWITIKSWRFKFKKDGFLQKLEKAKQLKAVT